MKREWVVLFLFLVCNTLLVFLVTDYKLASGQGSGTTERVSVASNGTQGNNGSGSASISANGRYVAFYSEASNLVSGDTNSARDIFVHDRQTGQTTRVSIASDGMQGNGNSHYNSSISADGRYVAFASEASNLVSSDTNGLSDVFVHDRQTGQTTRISVASSGAQGNSWSFNPSISADGRYVAFASEASNLVSSDTNGLSDVFVHDRQTGQTTRVSNASDGTQGNNESGSPSISADGRYVAFDSEASNLVSSDTNGLSDVFVHDRQTGQTTRVSVASNGTQGNSWSFNPSISADDGRYVAFYSWANNLVSGDNGGEGGFIDVFVHDQQTGQTSLVSVDSNGAQGNEDSWSPSISADGRYVAFESDASNLAGGDTNGTSDIFVHDQQTGQTTRVSVASNGTQGNNDSWSPSISADGRYKAFRSRASNLVSGDTNGFSDVFVHVGTTHSISGRVTDSKGNAICGVIISDAAGQTVKTNSNGNYILTGLAPDTYTLTPSLKDYSFSPSSMPVSVPPSKTGQNFTGTPTFTPISAGSPENHFRATYATDQSVTGRIKLWNLSFTSHTYTISVTITSGSNTILDDSRTMPIAGCFSSTWLDYDLGSLPEGDYHIAVDVYNEDGLHSLPVTYDFAVHDYPDVPPTDKPLVIFVHGCCGGNGNSFGNFPQFLASDGYPVYVIDDPDGKVKFWPPGTTIKPSLSFDPIPGFNDKLLPEDQRIEVSGDNLLLLIDDAKSRGAKSENEKVILITHSKGGLVSRSYLESFLFLKRKDVSRIIMLGTPNLGSPLARIILPRCLKTLEICELTPEAMLGFNQRFSTRAPNVDYQLIAGDYFLFGNRPFGNPVVPGKDDFVVAVDSVHGISGDNVYSFIRKNVQHYSGGYMTLDIYNDCIKPLIKGEPASACSDAGQLNSQTSGSFVDPVQAGYFSGDIATGQTRSQTVQIDGNGISLFQLMWTEGELDLTLFDPLGTPVTPVSAGVDPNIQFSTTPITEAIVATASYFITTTMPGLWTLEVTGNDTGGKSVSFDAVVLIDSDLGMTVSTDKVSYAPGQSAIINAELSDAMGGFAGASLTATIYRPDDVSQTLTLYDDGGHNDGSSGDGIYGNAYNDTTISGYYAVAVQATGVRNSTPFERSAQALFAVGSTNASLIGNYNDFPLDDDGDGFYGGLAITVGVNTIVSENYSLAVVLKDGAGEVIANQVAHTNLMVGTSFIPVVFDGQIIRNHGMDGPYSVAVVRLFDNASVALQADEAFNVWTTAAYEHSQFGSGSAGQIYLPIILKQ